MRRARRSTKGVILSRERMTPLNPQENARGVPLDPQIGSLDLEELRSLRNQVQCTWLRHEPSAIRYVLQPRLTVVRRV